MIPAALAWLMAAGAQAAGYPIAGMVVNTVTRQPVSGARVTIAPLNHRDQQIPFVTGPDGRFLFAGIPQGKYELCAQSAGFLAETLSGAIVTGPDLHTNAIVLPLSPPAIIAGKVVDDAGEPVARATVQLLSSVRVNGRRRIVPVGAMQTADTGDFRFGSLSAGAYYLAASGAPWYTKYNQTHGDSPPPSMTHAGYAVRYYPDAAEPLLLNAGQESTVDFALMPVPAITIHVHVQGGEELTKQFTLTTAGLGGNQVIVRQGSGPGDLYSFWGVPPGHYSLRVQAADTTRSWYGTHSFEAGPSDLDISVALLEAPTLSGTVTVEGGSGLPPDLSVLLADTESGARQSLPIGAGGKFERASIPPQRCRLALAGVDEYYLKGWSVEGGRRDGDTLEIPGGAALRLKLVAARGTGRVEGTVYREGRPLAGAQVVLAGAAQPDDARALASNSDGSYEFAGVPPGTYDLSTEGGAVQRLRIAPGGVSTQRLESITDRPASASPKP